MHTGRLWNCLNDGINTEPLLKRWLCLIICNDKFSLYIIDLDGTVWEDTPNDSLHILKMLNVFDRAIEWINKKYDEGNYICLFTMQELKH